MSIVAAKNMYFDCTVTISVKTANKTFDTISVIPLIVMVNAASAFVYPESVIISGSKEEKA